MATETVGKATSGTFVSQFNTASKAKVYYAASKSLQYVDTPTHGAYVYLNLPADLAGKTVTSAVIELTLASGSGSRTVSVQRHAKPVTAYAAMTWNNKPAVLSGSTATTVTQAATSTAWSFDVTDDVQQIADGGAYYGWRVTSTFGSNWTMAGWSSTGAARIVVEVAESLDAPVGLTPDGIVSLAGPTFRWLGSSELSAAQMQVDVDGGDFTAPVWDSGEVATALPQLTPTALGWAGLANNQVVSVRIRQRVSAGLSDWSLPVTVIRKVLAAVAITSPVATTGDPTPVVVHTFGGTQARWQKVVTIGGKVVADSGVTPGTDLSWTPTHGATTAGQVLSIETRVWDDQPRTASPGDLGYASATVATTYTPSAALAGVNELSATQDGVRPWVDLDWVRSAGVPDEWVVVRDDVILDRFPGSDDDGAVLTFRDWTCPPNRDVYYRVFPVTNGVVSANSMTTLAHTVVSGVWLISPLTGRHFSITGSGTQVAHAEVSAVYEPIGSSAPLKRTFAMRGLEGTVSGEMTDFDDRTVFEQEADLYAIKGTPSAELRLVAGDINVPVVVSDLTTFLSPDYSMVGEGVSRIVKTVSFAARQVGELPFAAVTP